MSFWELRHKGSPRELMVVAMPSSLEKRNCTQARRIHGSERRSSKPNIPTVTTEAFRKPIFTTQSQIPKVLLVTRFQKSQLCATKKSSTTICFSPTVGCRPTPKAKSSHTSPDRLEYPSLRYTSAASS